MIGCNLRPVPTSSLRTLARITKASTTSRAATGYSDAPAKTEMGGRLP
ncbi:Uncharacterised protein [Mycobacteroides abscessus subsp. abscessus]|nr:Uncharacterised protein [Mycobacteroides abscessus subsp. abscessus]